MDSNHLPQHKHQIESIMHKNLQIEGMDLLEQIYHLKEFMKHQGLINKKHQREKKHIEEDLSLLKILCLEQKEKIDQLKKEIYTLQETTKSSESNELSKIAVRRSLEIGALKKELSIFKDKGKGSNPERSNSISSAISKLKISQLSPRKTFAMRLSKSPEESQQMDLSPKFNKCFAQLQNLLKNGHISNNLRDTLISIGEQLKNHNKHKQSLKYYLQANEICQKLKQEQINTQAEVIFWIACNMSQLGNYNEAIRYYMEELNLRESTHQTKSENIAATYNNIGHNYYCKNQHNKAIEYFEKAVEMQVKIKGKYNSSVGLYLKNMAEVFFSAQNYKLTEKYSLQSLEIFRKVGEERTQYSAWSHYFLSVIYFKAGRYFDCLKHLSDCGKAYSLYSNKEHYKEMLQTIIKKSEEKRQLLQMAYETAYIVFDKNEGREIKELLKDKLK